MDDWVGAMLIGACIFFGAIAGGFAAEYSANKEWQEDCQKVGFHRIDDKVYECKLKQEAK